MEALFYGWTGTIEQRLQNLLINVPPGCCKSAIVGRAFPAWCWIHDPGWKAICISANPRVALRDAVLSRQIIESDWYQHTFSPDWQMAEDANAKGNYRNTKGGFRISQGCGAKLTGDRGDCLIFDDLHDLSEANSEAIRQQVIDYYDQTASNRVNDSRKSTRIYIGQRVHEGDISSRFIDLGWTHLCIPQEFVPERKCSTPIGWKDPRTEAGELMFPLRFPLQVLTDSKKTLTEFGYSAQHQQDPMSAVGNLFRKSWFRYYKEHGDTYHLDNGDGIEIVGKAFCKRFTTCDFAYSTKTSADYTVMATWDVDREGRMLLVDLVRERMSDPDLELRIEKLWADLSPAYIAIEARTTGSTMIQRLNRKPHIRVKALKSEEDKVQRSLALRVDMGNGKVYFPKGAPYLGEITAELLRFPQGKHDDFVDAAAYAAIDKINLVVGASSILTHDLYDKCVIPSFKVARDTFGVEVEKCGSLYVGISGRTKDSTTVWVIERGEDALQLNTKLRRVYRTLLVRSFKNVPYQTQFEEILKIVGQSKVRKVAIENNGVCAGLAEQLQSNSKCIPWNTSAMAQGTAIERLAMFVAQNRIGLPPDDDLKNEILSVQRITGPSGNIIYEGQVSTAACDGMFAAALALEAGEGSGVGEFVYGAAINAN